MRTGLFLVAGFLLLAASLLLGKLFSANYPSGTGVATVAYVVLWYIRRKHVDRVARAGYSVRGTAHICAHLRSSRCCGHPSQMKCSEASEATDQRGA